MKLPYTIDTITEMADGVFLVNRDRQITLWNESASRITGFDQSDTFGKSFAKHIQCHVDFRGKPLADDQCPLKKALNTGKPQQMMSTIKNKSGQLVPVNILVIPYCNEAGFVAGAIEQFSIIEPKHMPASSDRRKINPSHLEKKTRRVGTSA